MLLKTSNLETTAKSMGMSYQEAEKLAEEIIFDLDDSYYVYEMWLKSKSQNAEPHTAKGLFLDAEFAFHDISLELYNCFWNSWRISIREILADYTMADMYKIEGFNQDLEKEFLSLLEKNDCLSLLKKTTENEPGTFKHIKSGEEVPFMRKFHKLLKYLP